MSVPIAARPGWLARPSRAIVMALVAIRVLVLLLVVVDANRGPVTDPEVLRTDRVASSPAAPYRGFPVESMPIETLMVEVLGGSGAAATAVRIALVAFLADLAVAAALGLTWGWRTMAVYFVLGLPLLSFVYQRLDLVSVAFAVWAMALLRARRDESGGALLGLAIMTKLWPLALAPLLVMARRWRSLLAGAVLVGAIGIAWFFWGGPKAPFQVLTFRDAIGWSVESAVGNLVWLLTGGPISREGEAVTIAVASVGARALLLLAMLVTLAAVWWRTWQRRDHDPAGAASLAAVAALVTLAPRFSLAYAAWLLPWTALAIAVALTGVIAILTDAGSQVPGDAVKWLLLLRNGLLVGVLVRWLMPGREHDEAVPSTAAS